MLTRMPRMLCEVCQKGPRVGYNRPNSQHRTKRKIYPNIQKNHGQYLCTGCLKSVTLKSFKKSGSK